MTVTRFAPSPSGELHLGNVRTALFCWLLARREGGRFVLRIEDTDAERSREAHTASLMSELRWLGLDWDEGPDVGGPAMHYRQSERRAHYDAGYVALQAQGRVYPCFCSPLELDVARRAQLAAGKPPRYAGTCRELSAVQRSAKLAAGGKPVLRFRVPARESVAFDDFVHGPQNFFSDDIGDFIVRRADGSAAFFYCNALDDAAMGITHVLRGEDHLTNTPRQILLFRALGLTPPSYGHVALLVGNDGAPLSKRHGAQSLRDLREQGLLPAAIYNHLFRLGHSSPENGFLTLPAMAKAFDTQHLGRAPARFDNAQLLVWQKEAVQRLDASVIDAWLAPIINAVLPAALATEQRAAFIAAIRANVVLPGDARHWAEVVFGGAPALDATGQSIVAEAGHAFFAAAAAAVLSHGGDWQAISAAARDATGRKGAALFKPLRYALSGQEHGPELAPLLRLISVQQLQSRLLRFAT